MENRALLKEYKNGNKLWGRKTTCAKCSGTGKVIWTYADHVCFDCDGKGWYYEEEREFTPANIARLEAKRAKERANWEAEQAEREAKRKAELEEEARREAERLAEIERNRGQFIGAIGDKIEMTVTLARTFEYEAPCYSAPWKTDLMTGYVFKTDDGNTLVWMTSGSLHRKVKTEKGHFRYSEKEGWFDYEFPEEGATLTIKATIKGHKEYNNVNQTVLTRVKWVA